MGVSLEKYRFDMFVDLKIPFPKVAYADLCEDPHRQDDHSGCGA